MNYYIIPASLIITLILVLILSLSSKRPFRGLGLFFLIIFLATWAGQLWITPFGPVIWGVTWVPLVVVSIFFLFLILALIPPVPLNKKANGKAEDDVLIALGSFFWAIMILLILAIVLGYYKS
jgi:hypothetical protein